MGNLCGRDYEVDDSDDEQNENKIINKTQPLKPEEQPKAPDYTS